ncbi:MAG: hypothetical protein ACYDAM_06495 [Leptospirales bacterium]
MVLFKILTGFFLLLLGSALFSFTAERIVHRLFRNRQAGGRLLGNLSLSLPEAILPLYAFLTPSDPESPLSSHFSSNIGVGAILGAPLFLLLVLWPLYLWKTRKFPLVETRRIQLSRETPLLMSGLAIAMIAGVVPSRLLHLLTGCLLAGLYLGAFFLIESPPGHPNESPEQEHLPPSIRDYLLFACSAILILLGPEIFLSGLNALGRSLHSTFPLFLSMGLSALATESPEALALFFLLKRKERALGFDMIWGSISFQMTVSLSIGLFFSRWTLLNVHLALGGVLLMTLLLSFLYSRSTYASKGIL